MSSDDTSMSRAYEAGNFDNAYVGQVQLNKRTGDEVVAYLLGYFASYELREIPVRYRERVETARNNPRFRRYAA